MWSSKRYFVDGASSAWNICKTLPSIITGVMATGVPVVVFSVIHIFIVAYIFSLKVVVIGALRATFTASLAGLPAIGVGGVLSVVKLRL